MSNNTDNKSIIISTKVTPNAANKFNAAAERMGMNSGYELVQLVIDCLLRYIDAPSHATNELKRMMQIFDDFTYSTGRLRLTNAPIGSDSQITKAIYFVRNAQKKYEYLVKVDKPFMGNANEDYNVQTMFKDFLSCAFPRQWAKLTDIARAIGTDNELEAFQYLLDEDAPTMTQDEATYTELFADTQRDITGARLNVYDKKYIMHQHHNIDPIQSGKYGRETTPPRTAEQ